MNKNKLSFSNSENFEPIQTELLWRDLLTGSKTFLNTLFSFLTFFGGLNFIVVGVKSFVIDNAINVPKFLNLESSALDISFFPQGLSMLFYGVVGVLFSLYLGLLLILDVGSGYNEFNKETQTITLFRKGFPGKYRRIFISLSFSEVQSLQLKIFQGLNNQKATLFLKIKGKKDLVLNEQSRYVPLNELERISARLADFLQVPLEITNQL